MKKAPLIRRRNCWEYSIVFGLFWSAFGLWQLKAAASSGGIDVWFAVGLLAVGLWTFVDCWMFSRGVHELRWEGDHTTLSSDGKVVFEGALRELKAVVGDQSGYDLHPQTGVVYRVKSGNVSDDLRALLDAACA